MPSSSIGGMSSGSGKCIEGESSSLCFLVDRSFNGAASISALFKGTLWPYVGSGKSARFSFGGSFADWLSIGDDFSGFTLGNVVNRADCGIDDVVARADDETGCGYVLL